MFSDARYQIKDFRCCVSVTLFRYSIEEYSTNIWSYPICCDSGYNCSFTFHFQQSSSLHRITSSSVYFVNDNLMVVDLLNWGCLGAREPPLGFFSRCFFGRSELHPRSRSVVLSQSRGPHYLALLVTISLNWHYYVSGLISCNHSDLIMLVVSEHLWCDQLPA